MSAKKWWHDENPGDPTRGASDAKFNQWKQSIEQVEARTKQLTSAFDGLAAAIGRFPNAAKMFAQFPNEVATAANALRDWEGRLDVGSKGMANYIEKLERMAKSHSALGAAAQLRIPQMQAVQAAGVIGLPEAPALQKFDGKGLLAKAANYKSAAMEVINTVSDVIEYFDRERLAAEALEDKYTLLTRSAERFADTGHTSNQVLDEQADVAHVLRTSLANSVQIYGQVQQGAEGLSLSHEQLIKLQTELGKAAMAAGQPVEAAGTLMQKLSEAFESGAATAPALQQIMKQFPELGADWINTFGGSKEAFLTMVEEGRVNLNGLVDATLDGNDQIELSYRKLGKYTNEEMRRETQETFERLKASGVDSMTAMGQAILIVQERMEKHRMTVNEWADELVKRMNDIAHAQPAVPKDPWAVQTESAFSLSNAFGTVSKVLVEGTNRISEYTKELNNNTSAAAKNRAAQGGSHCGCPSAIRKKDISVKGALSEMGASQTEETGRNIALPDRGFDGGLGALAEESPVPRPPPPPATGDEFDNTKEKAKQANEEIADDAKDKAREFKRAWAEGAGSVAGNFVKAALEGKKSFGEMVEDALTKLALLAVQQAALQMGGPGGAFAGSLVSSIFGGANGFDHVVGSKPGLELPGFASGGDFTVGGAGGIDSKIAMFRVTPGESVHVRTPEQQAQAGGRVVAAPRVQNVIQVSSDPREVTSAMGSYSGQREYVKLNRKFKRRN
jgi:hypothetical protein